MKTTDIELIDGDIYNNINLRTVSKRIIDARKQRNLSQVAFAKLCGLSKSTISRVEAAEALPTLNSFFRISDYLNLPMDYLIGKEQRSDVDFKAVSLISNFKILSDREQELILTFVRTISNQTREAAS